MKLIINGQEKVVEPNLTLKDTISQFVPHNRKIIAEVNGDIIKSLNWESKQLREGDKLELVNVVGGG